MESAKLSKEIDSFHATPYKFCLNRPCILGEGANRGFRAFERVGGAVVYLGSAYDCSFADALCKCNVLGNSDAWQAQ